MLEKTAARTSDAMMPFTFEAMMKMQRPALATMAEMNTRLYESISAVNQEWTAYVNRCLKEDLAVPQQLAECKNLPDLYRLYAQFFQTACSQCQSNLKQMTKFSASLFESTLQALQNRSEEAGRTHH
jgi:hypothetical protein